MKRPKIIRTLQSKLYTLKSKEEEKQIKKALRIEKAILSFLPKKRRGFFQIGSKVVVLNLNNSLNKEPFKIGFIHAFKLNQYGFEVEVLLPPYKSLCISTFEINEVYHSIKELAEHNKKYLCGRLEEYCRLLKDENYIIPMNTKPIYQRISRQIKHILMKCKLPIPFNCI